MERSIIYSTEFCNFKQTLSQRALEKLEYGIAILQHEIPLSKKFVKKILGSDLYELRISVEK